jgi:hypothetical protein
MGIDGERHAAPALPMRSTRYAMYKKLGGPQGQSGPLQKISTLSRFDTRTVQHVTSLYTDWAIPAHILVRDRDSNFKATC